LQCRFKRNEQLNALLVLVDPFTREHGQRIVDFAAKRHLPAIYESREFVDARGLISYGPSLPAVQRRVADYVDMIFKGARPGDLPVEQPTKFEMVINKKAAKELGDPPGYPQGSLLNHPTDVAVDPDGDIYVADWATIGFASSTKKASR
jgi:ABC transporter substrate binding protein/NHL repeat